MPEPDSIPFATFQKHLARITHLDPSQLAMETNLVVDLGLDSLKLLEVVLEFENLGVPVSLADAWGIQTVGDAYEYCQRAMNVKKTRSVRDSHAQN
jgi:acyl carrier protein